MSRRYRRKKPMYMKKRRPWYAARNMAGYGTAAMTALKIAKEVKGMLNVEYKVIDTHAGGVSVPETGTVIPITLAAQGTDYDQHTGDQIKVVSIDTRILVRVNTDGDLGQIVRAKLFCDTKLLGSAGAPTMALVQEDASSLVGPRDHNNRSRFITLWDKVIKVSEGGMATNYLHKYKDFVVKCQFTGVTDTIAAALENHLFLLMWSSQATTNYPTVDYWTRVRFLDN